MIISQWKNGDRTFFSLEVDDRLLLFSVIVKTDCEIDGSSAALLQSSTLTRRVIAGDVSLPGWNVH